MNKQPAFYRILYSPGTAAFMILLAGAFLAAANGRAVYDFFRGIHPEWGPAFLFVNAAGTELGIIAVGLVYAATGKRALLVGESVLVAASAWVSYLVAAEEAGIWTWQGAQVGIPAASIPLLYLITVLAGHHLAENAASQAGEGAHEAERDRADADSGEEGAASVADSRGSAFRPIGGGAYISAHLAAEAAAREAEVPASEPEDPEVTGTQRRNAERYANLAAEVGDDTRAIAERLEVSPRTVRNYREVARKLGLVTT